MSSVSFGAKSAKSIKKQSINKRSGFDLWTADGLPELNDLLKQIPRARGYLQKRQTVRLQFEQERACFGVILATIRAQIAVDKANGVKSDFPLASVWYAQIAAEHRAFALHDLARFGVAHVDTQPSRLSEVAAPTVALNAEKQPENAPSLPPNPPDTIRQGAIDHHHTSLPPNPPDTSPTSIQVSGFLSWRGEFPSLEAVLEQIMDTPHHKWREMRQYIRLKFEQEQNALIRYRGYDEESARRWAIVWAQQRADSVRSVYAPLEVMQPIMAKIARHQKGSLV